MYGWFFLELCAESHAICENTKACFIVSVWLFFPRIVCRIAIRGNTKACFSKPYKCIAGFSQNCVQTSLHSVTDEGSTKCPVLLGKCTAGFSSNCVHTLSNSAMDDFAPSVDR